MVHTHGLKVQQTRDYAHDTAAHACAWVKAIALRFGTFALINNCICHP